MIKLNLNGLYRAKIAIRLFGKTLHLGSYSGSLDRTVAIAKSDSGKRLIDLGPVELAIVWNGESITVAITITNGIASLWSHTWKFSEVIQETRWPVSVSGRGFRFEGILGFQND